MDEPPSVCILEYTADCQHLAALQKWGIIDRVIMCRRHSYIPTDVHLRLWLTRDEMIRYLPQIPFKTYSDDPPTVRYMDGGLKVMETTVISKWRGTNDVWFLLSVCR